MKKLLLSITVLGLILFCGLIVATSENTQIAEEARASTVKLDISHGGYGSGFLVAPGRVATNLHVIIQEAKTGGDITGTAKLVGKTDSVDIRGYTAVNVKQDLIILDIPGLKAPSLRLGDSNDVKIGQAVYVVGTPWRFEGSFSEGNISGIREDINGKLFQMTAPVSPGSSGGPVLNKDGEVIGITVSVGPAPDLNWAIPVNDLKILLEKQFSSPNHLNLSRDEIINRWGFEWLDSDYPSYKFFLENISRQNVTNIYCLTIFFDEKKKIIGMDHIRVPGIDAGKKKEIICRSIFTYKIGEGSEEFRNRVSNLDDDDRARILSQKIIKDHLIGKNKVVGYLSHGTSYDSEDYNFLAPNVRQVSEKENTSIIILGYNMTENFNPTISRP